MRCEAIKNDSNFIRPSHRGSKLLGFPTANLDPEAFKNALSDCSRGVYCGWVSIDKGPVYKVIFHITLNTYVYPCTLLVGALH